MKNNNFKSFINQDFLGLSKWLDSLNAYEFSLIGVIAAYIISISLNTNEQNSIGNFLEEVGQILLTISAQNMNLNNSQNIKIEEIMNEIEKLKMEIYKNK